MGFDFICYAWVYDVVQHNIWVWYEVSTQFMFFSIWISNLLTSLIDVWFLSLGVFVEDHLNMDI
jgi:hypothetical protein